MDTKQNTVLVKKATMILGFVLVAISIGIAVVSLRSDKKISDFEDCKAAGGTVLEMYPEQCRINGASYINEAQSNPDQPAQIDKYIGLSESEALARAGVDSLPARVVERDGESLPVTMDFVFGRYNLYVKNGEVYKIEVEGQATDN